MLSIPILAIISLVFCPCCGFFLVSLLYPIIVSIPVAMKMSKKKMINGRPVLAHLLLFFCFFLIIFIVPLLIFYIFFASYSDMATMGYVAGIISFFIFLNKDKAKKSSIDAYVSSFGEYIKVDKIDEATQFLENYLKK